MQQSGVRLSVRLSHLSTAATSTDGFAAECPAVRRYRSIAAGAVLQALSSRCGQRRVESRRRRFNTDVFVMPSCSRSENTRRRPQYQKHVNIALSSRENRAKATANFLKFGHVVPGICDQTDRHACTPIAKPIARTPVAAK